jgi:hypothetical protein
MTARRREKPLPKQVADFVIHHLADKRAFAPFTGTDHDAWLAFLYLVRLWGRTRSDDVVRALRAVVHAAQTRHEDVMAVFKKSIPCLLDWSDEPKLWQQIGPSAPLTDIERAQGKIGVLWPCRDGERVCAHERSRPYTKEGAAPGWQECRECGTIWKPTS